MRSVIKKGNTVLKRYKHIGIQARKVLFKAKKHVRNQCLKLVKTYKSSSKYTVVSACYNVEKYIDDFVESLVNQTLDFKNCIQLVLVDDGSTDHTAEKIKSWVQKYPDNIQYVYKENGGQASARNLGLKYAKNEWISFADPDDFFDQKCFQHIDHFLATNQSNVCLIGLNMILFFESRYSLKNIHPLKYKFKPGITVLDAWSVGDFIQLSAGTTLLKKEIIDANNLRFNELCRPNFEDTYFINSYLSYCKSFKVAYLKKAKYFFILSTPLIVLPR